MLIIQRPTVEPIGEPDQLHQRFALGPLDPGFGHSLGASLRRTLLSSIPGAAVTQVRFDDALHEFTFVPGVKEDVSDIILNLKDLVLRSESDTPVTMRIDVRGPADVTGADLRATSDVEVLNPEAHIATVNAKGRLAIDVTVERGKGYAPAERKQSTAIGVIPVDAIYSPGSRSPPISTASCSTLRPTARSRPARRLPQPARPCVACFRSSPSSPARAGASSSARSASLRPARRTSTFPSRTWIFPSAPATV